LIDLTFPPSPPAFKDAAGNHPTKLVVGLVGYPNVGKSSTINALIGEKKVSVSATPGKTKHFQTINLSSNITLCDCPGLVFPQFATTKASMVCDGVLPIDQMREYTGPTTLVIKRIMKEVIEATYGLDIQVKGVEDGGDGVLRAEDLLSTYAGTSTRFAIRSAADLGSQLPEDSTEPAKVHQMKPVHPATSLKTTSTQSCCTATHHPA
jgi:ribosome biogenesis GTPase A